MARCRHTHTQVLSSARTHKQSLTHTPPDEVSSTKRCGTSESPLNTYSASGLGRALTKATASLASRTRRMGKMGPKISSSE